MNEISQKRLRIEILGKFYLILNYKYFHGNRRNFWNFFVNPLILLRICKPKSLKNNIQYLYFNTVFLLQICKYCIKNIGFLTNFRLLKSFQVSSL